jgi:hypothetical protein
VCAHTCIYVCVYMCVHLCVHMRVYMCLMVSACERVCVHGQDITFLSSLRLSLLVPARSVLQSRLAQKDQENSTLRQQWSDVTLDRKRKALTEEEHQRTAACLAQVSTQLAFKEHELLSQTKEVEQYRAQQAVVQLECGELRQRLAQLEGELQAAQLQAATARFAPSRVNAGAQGSSPSAHRCTSPILARPHTSSPLVRLSPQVRTTQNHTPDTSGRSCASSSSAALEFFASPAHNARESVLERVRHRPTWLQPAITSSAVGAMCAVPARSPVPPSLPLAVHPL